MFSLASVWLANLHRVLQSLWRAWEHFRTWKKWPSLYKGPLCQSINVFRLLPSLEKRELCRTSTVKNGDREIVSGFCKKRQRGRCVPGTLIFFIRPWVNTHSNSSPLRTYLLSFKSLLPNRYFLICFKKLPRGPWLMCQTCVLCMTVLGQPWALLLQDAIVSQRIFPSLPKALSSPLSKWREPRKLSMYAMSLTSHTLRSCESELNCNFARMSITA